MSGMQKQNQKQEAKTTAKSKKSEQKASQQLNAMQMMDAPETMRSEDVLAAQQQVGNQVVQRTLGKGKKDAGATDEKGNLRPEIASTIQQKRGGGEALPEGVRKEAQKVLGKAFKNVRIHKDSTSDRLSRSVNARAFTIGSDIFFKNGVFAPGTSKGRETLMHELTHVVQQSGSSKSSGGKLKLGGPETAMEKQADHIGKKHAQAKVGAAASAIGTVQKAPLDDEELLQGQPEEEELQMQPDAGNVVQRVEEEELIQGAPEEEELQMQPDAGNVVQRVEEEELIQGAPEEEELQMQPDAGNVVQRVEDEELIQGAPEEEELQMQPDVGNVVQRDWEDGVFDKGKLNYKKYSKSVLGGQRIAPGISKQVAMFGGGIGQTKKTGEESSPKSPTVKKKVLSRPKPQVPVKKPNITGADPKDTGKSTTWKKGVISKTESIPDPKVGKRKPPPLPTKPKPKWVRGVKPSENIPEAPPLPSQNGKKQEGSLSLSDQIKAKSKSMRSNSQRENLAKLEQDRMQKTGKRVSEQFMEDQANKPKSKWQKFKGFAKKAGGSALSFGKLAGMAAIGKVGSKIKSNLTQAKEQFFGKSKEEGKEEAPKASPVTINNYGGGSGGGGVGGGGGGGGMAETISDLFQENKRLKTQIAELEKAKEKV